MSVLVNRLNKQDSLRKISKETFTRKTISFYKYVIIKKPHELRNELFEKWGNWGVLGRTYLATEGINAQICVPDPSFTDFLADLNSYAEFRNIPIKEALEESAPVGEASFWKLTIKVKTQIVADGLTTDDYDFTKTGQRLNAEEFNKYLAEKDTVVVDMRNHYESEVGHFENAVTPDVNTFREELPMVRDILTGKEDKKILLYCTGGIRCEKASAYLKHHGFKDVNQLDGGIIQYKREVEARSLPCKFHGKNFVFDDRMGERVTQEVISKCHQCGGPSDRHTNCANELCHLLFIQCENCKQKYNNCCTAKCMSIVALPDEERMKLRKEYGEKIKQKRKP